MAEVGRMSRARRPKAETAVLRRKKRRNRNLRMRNLRRGNRTLHYILIITFLLAAGITLSLTVFFQIDSVTAVGTDKYPPDDIVAASGIQVGDNMFRVDSKAVTENILDKFPYIESVEVTRKLPHAIQLQLTQCVAAGALSDGGDYLIIARDGKVLERGLVFIPEDIPLIKGIKTGGAKPGDTLGDEAADALRMLDYLFKAIDETGFGEITNVNLADPYNMKVVYENRLLINLGTESDLPAKLNFIKETIDNGISKDAQGLINASDISRSLNYTPMSLEDALAGKKRGSAEYAGTSAQDEELDIDEPEDAQTGGESAVSSE